MLRNPENARDVAQTVYGARPFLDLGYQDMGDILELPERTVKSRLFTARQLLRDLLVKGGVV
jgi:DNA-directed RNA polymerase specialized sigma24 family protein